MCKDKNTLSKPWPMNPFSCRPYLFRISSFSVWNAIVSSFSHFRWLAFCCCSYHHLSLAVELGSNRSFLRFRFRFILRFSGTSIFTIAPFFSRLRFSYSVGFYGALLHRIKTLNCHCIGCASHSLSLSIFAFSVAHFTKKNVYRWKFANRIYVRLCIAIASNGELLRKSHFYEYAALLCELVCEFRVCAHV